MLLKALKRENIKNISFQIKKATKKQQKSDKKAATLAYVKKKQ